MIRPIISSTAKRGLLAVAFVVALSLQISQPASAQGTEKDLFSFSSGVPSAFPSSLISDAAGNLYGTTTSWGPGACLSGGGCGTVFELSPQPGSAWAEKTLYTFTAGSDGDEPVSGVIFDAAGNLYGVASEGMSGNCVDFSPCGDVFELSPQTDGRWFEKVLYIFNGADGYEPVSRLVFDKAGNLYGTTLGGGTGGCNGGVGCGVAFELSPQVGGSWSEKVLYSFQDNGLDGISLYSGLVFDPAGNLYGTARGGGAFGAGVVYELSPQSGGNWTETTLHSFGKGLDGANPTAGVTLDAAGNIYGTAPYGGIFLAGMVFELLPHSGGGWTEKRLHSFSDKGMADGTDPETSLIFDSAGRLYGTTAAGGMGQCEPHHQGCGTAFELSQDPKGRWNERIVYNFRNAPSDGKFPMTSLILSPGGNLFGTTYAGGSANCYPKGCGVAFELQRQQY